MTTTTNNDETSVPVDNKTISNVEKFVKLRVLTVGDGDLSLSLAIARAYGEWVSLTASTFLENETILKQIHPTSHIHLQELTSTYNIPILYSVDACRLDRDILGRVSRDHNPQKFDLVIFHHPHLGDEDDLYHGNEDDNANEEVRRRQAHCSLIAHYLDSAYSITDSVQLAINSTQYTSWNVEEAAQRAGWKLQSSIPVRHPFHRIFPTSLFPWNNYSDWQPPSPVNTTSHTSSSARRKARHALARYGYQHVRTTTSQSRTNGCITSSIQRGSVDMTGSSHYVFVKTNNHNACDRGLAQFPCISEERKSENSINDSNSTFTCTICGVHFATEILWKAHLQAPAKPTHVSSSLTSIPSSSSSTYLSTSTKTEKQFRISIKSDSENINVELYDNQATYFQQPSCNEYDDGADSESREDEDLNSTSRITVTVAPECHEKRLRWFLQHYASLHENQNQYSSENYCPKHRNDNRPFPKKSKREWQHWIQSGMVTVNGTVAFDDGRVLQTGWIVSVETTSNTTKGQSRQSRSRVEIVDTWRWNDSVTDGTCRQWFVVWKPAGMRTIGNFAESTLEQIFTRQQQEQNVSSTNYVFYRSLSKLDTGCRGLCVLEEQNQDGCRTSKTAMRLTQTFTGLVHGLVPDDWDQGVTMVFATNEIRRWKKRQDSSPRESTVEGALEARVQCIERSWNHPRENPGSNVPALSTVTIKMTTTRTTANETFCSGIAPIITHHLRKHVPPGYPVVGDRFVSTNEYLLLPRAVRNRIKHRLCMGCTEVTIIVSGDDQTPETTEEGQGKNVFHTKVSIPERWSAHYWREFCMNSQAKT
jgi:hypothetical protein